MANTSILLLLVPDQMENPLKSGHMQFYSLTEVELKEEDMVCYAISTRWHLRPLTVFVTRWYSR